MTLIELLVAVAIFGVLSVAAYAALGRLLDGRDQLEREREYWRNLSFVFMRMGDDLAHALPRTVRDNSGTAALPALRGQPTDIRALGEPALELTRGGEIEYGTARRSDQRRVAWRLRDGTLERLTWPVLDRGPVSEPLESPMLGGVEAFELRFIGTGAGSGSTNWPPNTQPTNLNNLPEALEVSVTVSGRARYTRLFLVGG
jgi:general secretion pathway protein J